MRVRRFLPSSARHAAPVVSLILLAAAVGCSSRAKVDPNPPPHYTAPVVLDAAAPPGTYLPVEQVEADTLVAATANEPAPRNRPLNVLTVSGGGQFGAYAAGLLVGWSCHGDRPNFDVVTGISSGAMIAAIVFAGPKYDPLLRRLFTTLKTEDLFRYGSRLLNLVRNRSLASADPLRRMLDEVINDEFLADMRAAHCSGRRLFVGTMNVLTRRLVVWDLGAIASSGDPRAGDQVRRILFATSCISGMSPPVEIDVMVNGACVREYHADGGGVAQTFVRFGPESPQPDPRNPSARWLAGSNLYVIGGGKLYKDILATRPGFIGGILSNVSATLYALFRADTWRLYTLCNVSGMKFHMSSVPADIQGMEQSTEFDPALQMTLYTRGFDLVTRGNPWRLTPPGYEPGEEELPRAGFQFMTSDVPSGVAPPAGSAPAAPADPAAAPAPAPASPVVRPIGRVRHPVLFETPKL